MNYKNAYEELKRLYELLEKENAQLKDKIEKAIEYIKNNTHKTEWGDLEQDNESIDINDDITDTEFIESLLKILKGE